MQRSCKDATDSTLRLSIRLQLVLGGPWPCLLCSPYLTRLSLPASPAQDPRPVEGLRSYMLRALYDLSVFHCVCTRNRSPLPGSRVACNARRMYRGGPDLRAVHSGTLPQICSPEDHLATVASSTLSSPRDRRQLMIIARPGRNQLRSYTPDPVKNIQCLPANLPW
jgi:hypothetical protein